MNRYRVTAKLNVADSFQMGTPVGITVEDPRPYAAEEHRGTEPREIKVGVKCAEPGPTNNASPPASSIDFALEYDAPDVASAFDWGREELEARADVLAFMTLRHVGLEADSSCVEITPGKSEDLESILPGGVVPASGVIDAEVLRHVMGGTAFGERITPRIAGSLRWFRKGLGSEMPEDGFLSLWIALEMLGAEFAAGATRFMFCHRCQKPFKTCPSCKQSTESRAQASDGIVRLFEDHLGWPKKEFRTINTLQGKLIHKNVRLSEEFRIELLNGIGTLKEALVTAYEVLLEIGKGRHPFRGRLVLPAAFGVRLQVKFRVPSDGEAADPRDNDDPSTSESSA